MIAETVRTWSDRLRDALSEKHGELEGRLIAERYRNAFPAAYEEDVTAAVAIDDIRQLDEIAGAAGETGRLQSQDHDGRDQQNDVGHRDRNRQQLGHDDGHHQHRHGGAVLVQHRAEHDRRTRDLRPQAEIVAQVWPALGATDYTAYITELMAADCDGVFSGIWGGPFPAFAKQAEAFGFFDQFTYVSAGEVGSVEVAMTMGADMPAGIWTNSYEVFYHSNAPEHLAYVEALHNTDYTP